MKKPRQHARRSILGSHCRAKPWHDAVAIRTYRTFRGEVYYALSYREVPLDVSMRAPIG